MYIRHRQCVYTHQNCNVHTWYIHSKFNKQTIHIQYKDVLAMIYKYIYIYIYICSCVYVDVYSSIFLPLSVYVYTNIYISKTCLSRFNMHLSQKHIEVLPNKWNWHYLVSNLHHAQLRQYPYIKLLDTERICFTWDDTNDSSFTYKCIHTHKSKHVSL